MAASLAKAAPNPGAGLDGDIGPEYPEARELLKARKWQEAAIVLKSLVRKNPENEGLTLALVRSLTYSGRREEALSLLNTTRDSSRVRVISRMFLTSATFQQYQDGINLMSAGKFRAARERFEKALLQEPDNAEVLIRLGQCLLMEKDEDSAAERLKLARKLNPFEPELKLWLGRAMHQRGEMKEALEELKAAHQELKGSERAAIWFAEALFSAGQRASAMQHLEKDVAREPYHVSALMALARMRLESAMRESQPLWTARKELQLVSSRLPQYVSPELQRFEGELGMEYRGTEDEVRGESRKLIELIEGRIESLQALE